MLTDHLRAGDIVFVSGRIPIDGEGRLVGDVDDAGAQALRCFERIDEALRKAGGSLRDVVKTTAYLTDIKRDFDAVNRAYAEAFEEPYPARTTVGVELAPPIILVEIDAYAFIPLE